MITQIDAKNQITAGDYRFTFLNSGDLFQATYNHGTMINQLLSNPIDGSLNNIYLRIHTQNGIQVAPLLGVHSKSEICFTDENIVWSGEFNGVQYQVTFYLTEQGIWFWDVTLDGDGVEVDLIYGQDIAIASVGAVRNNEAYVAQYIDHKVFDHKDRGYVVCSRQNQRQADGFPYLQQGSLTKSVGYLTDGFQFFGLSYKETNRPEVLTKKSLPNEIYQYEFAYTGLQSEQITLSGVKQFVFYGLFKKDYPTAITSLEFEEEVSRAWEDVKKHAVPEGMLADKVSIVGIGEPLQTIPMSKEEMVKQFPNRIQEEWDGDTLLSFFTDTYEHVVLKEKELRVERPHGHILMSGENDKMKRNTLSTTSYMYGVFNSQLVVGNTSFNKLLSNTRNPLNIVKTSGQRIYVEIEGVYRLLTMPSLFEMGFNFARWYYKTEGETFIITNYTTVDTPEVYMEVRTESGKNFRYLVTNQVIMNANEYDTPFKIENDGETISFYADEHAMSANAYPKLTYRLRVVGADVTVSDESKLGMNVVPNAASLVVLELSETNAWSMTVQGLLDGEKLDFEKRDATTEIECYRDYYRNIMNGFNLSIEDGSTKELDRFNTLAWWYTHNMLVHYSVPHGLEQYSGAAWGTRDVCQGPAEYFLATQNYDSVKEIIKEVYKHQFEDDGNWPQWFMFDNYYKIQADESHGDIIVWPLKVLSDYLTITKDFSILAEQVPYTIRGPFEFTEKKTTILEHVKKEIAYIKDHFLHDTHLSAYGGGDWDDTLQPANKQLKEFMASSWTVALTYQALNQLAKVLVEHDEMEAAKLQTLAAGVEADFNKYILQSEVIPGFVYMEQPENVEFMVHPNDKNTGIHYRLLPMQRSIISELVSLEQAEANYQLIKEKLYCPDGVRLMDKPAHYEGGVSKNFMRAEQAANFGREIGLQYVHAHIRFVEAMAKLGKVDEVWRGLSVINPVGIRDAVPNAELRQSNTYFSSSDGKFNTRYDAQENFGKLRDGSVQVKGGWRIYSSGPGIYTNQLISNCLGIRPMGDGLVIDPVIPGKLDGLKFKFKVKGKPVTFVYHLKQDETRVVVNGQVTETERLANRYRQGGFYLNEEELNKNLTAEANIIEVFC